MNLSEMTLADVMARIEELDEEVRSATDVDAVNKATEEKASLIQRKAELEDLEQRTADAAAINNGEVIADKTIEERKEENTVELNKDSKEYRSAWLKSLQGKNLDEVEARAYASTDANNAIPTLVADKFFEKMKKVVPMLNEITLMQVAGDLKFIVEGSRADAATHTENATINASDDTILQVVLGAVEFAKIIYISKSAREMSIDAFEGWLVELLTGDIARQIDNYIINGGSYGVADITFTTNTNQILNTATTGYTYKNIMDLIALLPAGYDANAKFLCHKKTLYGAVKSICDSQNRPIFDPESKTLCGYPVLVDDYVTTANNALYLGDFKQVVGNFSIPIEIETWSAHEKGAIGFRGFASFDSKVANKEAFVRLVATA